MIKTNNTRLLFLVIFFLSFNAGLAKNTDGESLDLLLANTSGDSAKAELLKKLAQSSLEKNKSVYYYTSALEFEKDSFQRAHLLDRIGLFNWQLGNFQEAINHFNQAYTLFSQLNDSLWLGKVHNNIAVVNWGLGNTIDALSNYQKALAIREAIKDTAGVSKVMNNIGLVYQDWGLYDKAYELHYKALKMATEIRAMSSIAYSYANIGNCYENTNELGKALKSYHQAIDILTEKDGGIPSYSFVSVNIASVYSKMNQLDSAQYHYRQAVQYGIHMNNLNRIAIAEHHLGHNYLRLNQLDSARYYTQKSLKLSEEKNYAGVIRDNLFVLSKMAEKEGRTTSALDYYKQAATLKDSLFNAEKLTKFNDLQIKYFTEQQEKENQILRTNNELQQITIRQQKMVSYILITGGVLILLVLAIVARSRISLKRLSVKLEKSEMELRKANADKDKFFTIIAHDLKSPFNGFLGTTDLLVSNFDELPTGTIKKFLHAMKDSTSNLYALLESLLQWAQVQTATMQYRFEKVDVHQIAMSVTDLLETNANQKNITLTRKIQEDTLAYADEKSVASILRNLVSNAIKYTNPEGTVLVETIRNEHNIEISVTDNGIGMSKKTSDKLFDISQMVSQQGTENEQGTGLGLILTKEFVEKNKGRIWLKSEPGKGTKFTFTLPAFDEQKSKPPQ
ncbi:tetratricopeptide repeat-containing sensor histidine kinase [Sunxiuqinia sp. sy24]|uniref:tetratricopeptide repeat-containing sensor histidine kinase n=1 Tax=Sunxiuqinia sp. sy24 TaxID=3461495 RepID=UPI004045A148